MEHKYERELTEMRILSLPDELGRRMQVRVEIHAVLPSSPKHIAFADKVIRGVIGVAKQRRWTVISEDGGEQPPTQEERGDE